MKKNISKLACAFFMLCATNHIKAQAVITEFFAMNGGFYLDDTLMHVSISDIVKATDGEGIYTDCVLGLKECNAKEPCPMHAEYKALKKGLIHMLETNKIIDFKDKLDSGKFFLKN